MNNRLFQLVMLTILIIGGWILWKENDAYFQPKRVHAVGDLNIIWGVPDGDPIFVVTNMLPGDSESRTVTVVNSAASARPVAVRGTETSPPGIFPGALQFIVREGITDVYGGTSPTGPKTLQQFFTDSIAVNGISLSTIPAGGTTQYSFLVTLPTSAGNEYQNVMVIFDITFGIASDIPAECQDIAFTGPPIFGTDGDDVIHATSGNDLIIAFEGNDKVFGKLGDDCIIGGMGNDELRGEVGDDIIFGNEGDDLVVGANNEDTLLGGSGNDTMRGENGQDYMEGNEGDDFMTGGNDGDEMHGGSGNDSLYGENGNDEMFGETGNDFMDGGNGVDTIHGNEDDDTLHGKSGDDSLTGDTGTDSANGWSGTDTCDAESEVSCEL